MRSTFQSRPRPYLSPGFSWLNLENSSSSGVIEAEDKERKRLRVGKFCCCCQSSSARQFKAQFSLNSQLSSAPGAIKCDHRWPAEKTLRNGALKASNYLYRLHNKCFYRCATLSCQKRSAFPIKCIPSGPFRGQWRRILHPWRVDAANTILNTKTGFSLEIFRIENFLLRNERKASLNAVESAFRSFFLLLRQS